VLPSKLTRLAVAEWHTYLFLRGLIEKTATAGLIVPKAKRGRQEKRKPAVPRTNLS
jgi:hypothetical protein